MARGRILVVDDEESIRATLAQVLEDEGYQVSVCESGEECLTLLETQDFEVIMLDVWLPGMDGLKVLEEMRRAGRPEEVLMISGHGSVETAVKAVRLGAFDFIEKPLSLERVEVGVQNALKKHRLEERTRLLQGQLEGEVELVGESPAIRALKEQALRAAPTDARVLIFGENGTGKELVARLVHSRSLRAAEAFVEVNCAAIPQELIESELFGHRKGSFTGAIENKKGKFLHASGGTLFLDEVGDMSLATQAKVLRALQEQTIEPVGGAGSVKVDVRVLAATNKELPAEIAAGRFREDLFYRLNVVPLRVPPLRERRDDILLLAEYYLERYARRYGRGARSLAPGAREAMVAYPWPGNVRELKNLIERAVIMAPGEVLRAEDLGMGAPSGAPGETGAGLIWEGPLKEAREVFEREFIRRALERNAGNVSRTAEELDIERRHLYRRLASLGLRKESAPADIE